jgi:hypothetical protein
MQAGDLARIVVVRKKTTGNGESNRNQKLQGNQIFDTLGCYAAQMGSYFPTFRDNLLVPSSRASSLDCLTLKMEPTGCPEISVTTNIRVYTYITSQKDEDLIRTAAKPKITCKWL